jgi:transmembrane sensor
MEHIDDIIAKFFSGQNLTEKESALLLAWKAENEKEYSAIENSMAKTNTLEMRDFDTSSGWTKMEKRIESQKPILVSFRPVLKYAIAASIAILIGFAGFHWFKNSAGDFIVFKNNDSRLKQITLPDGSVVDLARNSELAYATNFNINRHLKLKGQAFFTVKRDAENPFSIKTDNGTVTVLGTSFNVNTKLNKTFVDVNTGLVQLTSGTSEIKLAKGESAWMDGITISEKTAVNPNFLAWKTGEFNFNSLPISEVIIFLETYFGDVIDYVGAENECEFSGSFHQQSIDEIVEAIVLSCNLDLSKDKNRIILK